MRIKKETIFEYRDLALSDAKETRKQWFASLQSPKIDSESEIEWVAEYVRVEIAMAEAFLKKWGFDGDPEEASKPKAKAFLESFLRDELNKERKALLVATQALDDLQNALSKTWFVHSKPEGFGAMPNERFVEALNLIRDEISLRKYLIDQKNLPRNYRTNQNEIVRAVSHVLLDAGYKKRPTARILARAIAEADEKVAMSENLVNSIAVTIEYIEREQREIKNEKYNSFLYP